MSTRGPAPCDHERAPVDLGESGLLDVRALPFSDLVGTEQAVLSNALRRVLADWSGDSVVAGFANRADKQ